MDKINCRILNWKEIQKSVVEIANQIKQENFNPDYIIAIARGGVVPSRLLCDELHIKKFLSIKVDHWGVTANKDGKARISQKLNVDLTNKKVLLMDDIVDSGESMKITKKYIETLNPEIVKTAALSNLINSGFLPNYFGQEKEWTWMIWPWNYKEDMVNLTNKLLSEKITKIIDIKNAFFTYFNLVISEEQVEEILEQIEYINNR